MITQKQNNIRWLDEETPPLDQEQTAIAASSWYGWSLWLRVFRVILARVAGFALAFPIDIRLCVPLNGGYKCWPTPVLVGKAHRTHCIQCSLFPEQHLYSNKGI